MSTVSVTSYTDPEIPQSAIDNETPLPSASVASYLDIARSKREQRHQRIPKDWLLKPQHLQSRDILNVPKHCGILTDRELQITQDFDAAEIVENIAKGNFLSREVTVAFCKRAAIAQQLTNCLTEILFDDAIHRAEELDAEQASNPDRTLRPLHGLPISLKDSFNIPGYDSVIGVTCYANKPDTKYSALAQMLLDLGAVLYCKTNVPQTMMTADSDNNVFGRTLNPSNVNITAGGSSGGEGALIAMRGSILGVGTDVAGSIRIPSLCNGIYGFRTSVGLVPFAGQKDPVAPGTDGVAPVAGPMATSLRSCNLFMKAIAGAEAWKYDESCLRLNRWETRLKSTNMRIGIVHNDGMYTPWPPVRRAMRDAASKLRSAGIELVDLKMPDISEAVSVTYRMFSVDGCEFIQDLIKQGGEPEVESVKRTNLAAIPRATLDDYFALNDARHRIKAEFQKFWLSNKLDALLYPPAPMTATPLDEWNAVTYTMLWNFLDYPAVIIPTSRVHDSDNADEIENAAFGPRDEQNYKLYTGPQDFENAPLSVQLVGMRQEDDRLMGIAEVVDQALHAPDSSARL